MHGFFIEFSHAIPSNLVLTMETLAVSTNMTAVGYYTEYLEQFHFIRIRDIVEFSPLHFISFSLHTLWFQLIQLG